MSMKMSVSLRRARVMPESVRSLYLRAFPAEERRPLHILSRLLEDPGSGVELYLIEDGESPAVPAGFITLWTLGCGVRYVEHFAIRPELRGGGIGAAAPALLPHDSLIVLEVEMPANPLACRRIEFYRRTGFTLHDAFRYVQPPYSPSLPEVEMKLMTRGNFPQGITICDIANSLRAEVYGAPAL